MRTLSIVSLIVVIVCVTADAAHILNDDPMLHILTRLAALEMKDRENAMKREQEAIHISNLESTLTSQAVHILNLESKLTNQAEHISQIESKLKQVALHTSNLELKLVDEEKNISEIESKLKNEVNEHNHLKARINVLEKHVTAQENVEVQVQSSDNLVKPLLRQKQPTVNTGVTGGGESRQKRLVLGDYEGPVAFQAELGGAETTHLGIGQKIVFNNVLTNLGNGYSNVHGLFTAPMAGIYIFSSSILSHKSVHDNLQASIKKNGALIARMYSHSDGGHWDQGSATIVTQLSTGDTIWVDVYGPVDASVYGDYYTSFMGCLITPL